MRSNRLLTIGIVLFLIGLLGLIVTAAVSFRGWKETRPSFGRGMSGSRRYGAPTEFKSNGERIYYTATSDRGDTITFSGGPMWLGIMGGSCIDCHGQDGRGGIHIPMTDETSPDIRYSVLTSAVHGDEPRPPYTDALIKRAIMRGLYPDDKPLNWAMPRWRMSDADLDDVIAYLKTL